MTRHSFIQMSKLQGTIRCESDARSTRFIVTLPLGGRK